MSFEAFTDRILVVVFLLQCLRIWNQIDFNTSQIKTTYSKKKYVQKRHIDLLAF